MRRQAEALGCKKIDFTCILIIYVILLTGDKSRFATREIFNGAWLSLVERHVRDVEAACSNHVAPIRVTTGWQFKSPGFFIPEEI